MLVLALVKERLLQLEILDFTFFLIIFAEVGRATHRQQEVGRRVERGWPYYFLHRRDGQHMHTSRSGAAIGRAGLTISCREGAEEPRKSGRKSGRSGT